MRYTLNALDAAALAVCAAVSLPGQARLFDAPGAVRAGLRLDAATVQELALPLRADAPLRVEVVLGARPCTLELRPHDVRARGFQLLVDDGRGLRRVPTPPSVTLRGEVADAGAPVAASLIDGSLSATIHFASETWGIQPLGDALPGAPAALHVVYRAADVRARGGWCASGGAAGIPDAPGVPGPQALKIAELAIDADYEYYQRNGSDVNNVNNAVTTVLNGVNVIYQRDVEIEHKLTAIVVRTAPLYAWTGDLCLLHDAFTAHWRANHTNVPRDVAHLFTGKGEFAGLLGCSSSAAICTISAYGVSKAYAPTLTTNVGLVAHEMGHLWGAGHCDATPPCNIMCSILGGCSNDLTQFGPSAISAIRAHRASRNCLSDPPPTSPPAITGVTPGTTTSWQPARITLTGTDLGQVDTVTVGGAAAAIVTKAATSLTFTPPSPFTIATHQVVATNVVGPSNPVNLTIAGNHPAVLGMQSFWVRGGTANIELHSDANWQAALFLSPSNSPSSAPGIVDLGIGANFTSLFFVTGMLPGADGTARLTLLVSLGIPSGTTLYGQAVAIPLANPTLPIEASNVVSSRVL
jgi:hypothetical protein